MLNSLLGLPIGAVAGRNRGHRTYLQDRTKSRSKARSEELKVRQGSLRGYGIVGVMLCVPIEVILKAPSFVSQLPIKLIKTKKRPITCLFASLGFGCRCD